jgi:hypothetical protein
MSLPMSDAAKRKAAGWPKLLSECRSLRVRLRREASNRFGVIPRGTAGTLDKYPASSWERLEFTADKCEHCGLALSVSRLSWRDFEVLSS